VNVSGARCDGGRRAVGGALIPREEALAAGADEYFVKPFSLGELLDRIGALASCVRGDEDGRGLLFRFRR
jgi:DNA-binding response OmpR family regulator